MSSLHGSVVTFDGPRYCCYITRPTNEINEKLNIPRIIPATEVIDRCCRFHDWIMKSYWVYVCSSSANSSLKLRSSYSVIIQYPLLESWLDLYERHLTFSRIVDTDLISLSCGKFQCFLFLHGSILEQDQWNKQQSAWNSKGYGTIYRSCDSRDDAIVERGEK